MLGEIDFNKREIAIIGAGFAGLNLAFILAKMSFKVVVYEAASHPGGMLFTEKIGSCFVEHGANGLLVSREIERLCKELEVRLLRARPDQRKKYIVRGGKMISFPPLSKMQLVQAVYLFLSRIFLKDSPDISLGDWVCRHLGREVLDYVVDPVSGGIFACDPCELAMPFYDGLQTGSTNYSYLVLKKILSRFFVSRNYPYSAIVPEGGMQALMTRLYERLLGFDNVEFRMPSKCVELPDMANVCICTPAFEAAELIQLQCIESANLLADIDYVPLVSANVILPIGCFRNIPNGTGVLFPYKEQNKLLGILFNSSAYGIGAPDSVNLRAFLGGSRNRAITFKGHEEIKKIVLAEVDHFYGLQNLTDNNVAWSIKVWPKAIPLYSPVHLRTLKGLPWIKKRAGNLLFASYTGQVSLRGMLSRLTAIIES
jgi:oxygen-dependent protoporphyrinogen oxidase